MTDQVNNHKSTETPSPLPQGPIMCAAGCGFFGNPRTNNNCSKCHGDSLKKAAAAAAAPPSTSTPTSSPTPSQPQPQEQKTPTTTSPSSVAVAANTSALSELHITPSANNTSSSSSSSSSSPAATLPTSTSTSSLSSDSSSSSTDSNKKKRNRCGVCQKKLGINYFSCRCSEGQEDKTALIFCAAHRLPHQHDCKFNIKSHHQSNISKANPEIKKSKMEMI